MGARGGSTSSTTPVTSFVGAGRWVTTTLVVAIYAALGLAAIWPVLPAQGHALPQCACGDPVLMTWFLESVPWALTHGHNPLFTGAINAPVGVNLAQNALMPLVGLIMAPLTLTAGPVASFNLLVYLAFPLSATAMFFVLRRWTGSTVPSFVGGLLFGFSTFSTGQGSDHPVFSFVALLPLILLEVHELLIVQKGSPYRHGVLLGLLVMAQFFISQELLTEMAIVLGGALLVVIVHQRHVPASVVSHAVRGFGIATAVTALGLAYPLWFMSLGPQHYSGAVHPASNIYRSDLLGPIVPTTLQWLHPSALSDAAQRITHLGVVHNDSYIGLPLLLCTLLLVVRYRRDRWIALSAATAAIAFVLSLGFKLQIAGHNTPVPLPFGLVNNLPVFANIAPVRFSLFAEMFLSIVVSLGMTHLMAGVTWERFHSPSIPRRRNAAILMAIAVIALLPIVPRWPYFTARTRLPAFFTGGAVNALPAGSTMLTYPLPDYPNDEGMLWQATTKMRFRLIGGYAVQRGPSGRASYYSPLLSPPDVEYYLLVAEAAETSSPRPLPPVTEQLADDVRLFIRSYQVKAVVVDPGSQHAQAVVAMFTAALGPPRSEEGVALWIPRFGPTS